MNTTKILTIVLFIVAIGLGYYLVDTIKFKIDEEERITRMEARVINKLMMIRDAQLAYQGANGSYTASWDTLLAFIDTGRIYITQRREETVLLDYGAEETTIFIDTLGSIAVTDTIFSRNKYPNFNLSTLATIPGSNMRFEMFADKILKGGVEVDVIEVRNVIPVDPRRSEDNEANIKKPLRFGSRTNITTAGNWE
ncbi:MAG: hypothetical protein RIF33_06185 [Cyclobacteriaceae bacterium]